MKKTNHLPLLVACYLLSQLLPLNTFAQMELLVRFNDGTHPDTISAVMDEFNATELDISPLSQIRLWQLDSFIVIGGQHFYLIGSDTLDIQETGLRARDKVKIQSGDPNYDTYLPNQYDPQDMTPGNPIPCDLPISCPANEECLIRIGLIDTGVDVNHPYLMTASWPDPYDFINNTGAQMDHHSHGTHIAGTIMQMANNVGANNIEIMPLRTQDDQGVGKVFDAIRAVDYAVLRRANIINMSLGYLGLRNPPGTYKPAPLEFAIDLAGAHQVLVIASAGNATMDIDTSVYSNYPAGFTCSNLIAVAATDCYDDLLPFSNFGDISVDLSAPGEVFSTVLSNNWGFKIGTSMAAGIVTGAAALLGTHLCPFDDQLLKDVILSTVDTISIPVNTKGRLNTGNALIQLLQALPRTENQEEVGLVENEQAELLLEVYPTPFKKSLTINWLQERSGMASITMADARGRIVYSQEAYFEEGMNALTRQQMDLAPGLYFITLKQGNKIVTQKSLSY